MITEQEITQHVWQDKYRYKNEKNIEASFKRVVNSVYAKDKDQDAMHEAYVRMIDRQWCPAGRIQAGAGTSKRVTLINCFVSPEMEDSLASEKGVGIMDVLKDASFTLQMGGGNGTDFSPLRPRGALVGRTGSISAGPLVFMDQQNAMCSTIISAGGRRGALMGTLGCWHPDIEEFIDAKKEPGRLTNFNVSILTSDLFMEAIKDDREWKLWHKAPPAGNIKSEDIIYAPGGEKVYVYKTVRARDLWEKIIRSTYNYAEPGVIFINRVNDLNNLKYCEEIQCTNPCGEQPLPPNGACNLGAINLAKFVVEPFTNPEFDYDSLIDTTKMAVRFLDNVLDVSQYPTPAQKEEAMQKRRTGLGITGLANALQFMKIRYGNNADCYDFINRVMGDIKIAAYSASIELAKERGPFPAFKKTKYLESKFIERLPPGITEGIAQYGIRNGVLLTIAPTGTTSLYYGNVSSGLEPTFMWECERYVKDIDKPFIVRDYGYQEYMKRFLPSHIDPSKAVLHTPEKLPDYMVTAQDLTVADHLAVQGACQIHIDASVSKTINCPADIPFEEFKNVYKDAYDMGLKGCTTYRPNPESGRGAVLKEIEKKNKHIISPIGPTKMPRPDQLKGRTYKVRWGNDKYYITFNWMEKDGKKIPFEMFINSQSVKHSEFLQALTRITSAVFRRGGDIRFMIEELEKIHSPSGDAHWINKEHVPSLVALIGQTLNIFLLDIGYLEEGDITTLPQEEDIKNYVEHSFVTGELCPKCEKRTLIHQEGCAKCTSCDYSECD